MPALATVVATIAPESGRRVLSFAPEARRVLDGPSLGQGDVRLLTFSGAVEGSCPVPGRPIKALLAPGGDAVLVLTRGAEDRRVLRLLLDKTRALLQPDPATMEPPGEPDDIAWLPDGTAIVVGQDGDNAFVLAGRPGRPWSQVALPPALGRAGAVTDIRCRSGCLAVNTTFWLEPEDGGAGASGTYRSHISTWALTPGDPAPVVADQPLLAAEDNTTVQFAFSDDGRHLARHGIGPTGSVITVWAAGAPPRTFDIPDVHDPVISRHCLAGRRREWVRVFRLTPDGPLAWGAGWRIPYYEEPTVSVADGPDGTYLAVEISKGTDILLLTDPDILDTYVSDQQRRRAAVRSLGRRRLAAAVPHLTRLARPAPGGDTAVVAAALGSIGTDEAIDVLLSFDHTVPEVREALDTTAADRLLDAVRRALTQERRAALPGVAALLHRRPDVPATAELCTLLGDQEPQIRAAAGAALAVRADPGALPQLVTALGDPDPETARQAGAAVRAVDPDHALRTVRTWLGAGSRKAVRDAAALLAERPDVPAVTEICGLLTDPEARIRVAAGACLAVRRDPVALPHLITAFADDDRQAALQSWTAVLALSLADPPEPAGALTAAAAFAAGVRQTGTTGRARESAPAGGELLGAVAAALVAPEQSADRTLNAVKAAGDSHRFRDIATALCLLAAERLAAGGALEQAIPFLAQTADQALKSASAEVEWRTRTALGDAHASARRWPDAHRHYAAAEQIIDRLWASLLGALDDRTFFADKAHLYEQAMLCRLRLGRAASSLETLERAKTRFLGDLIARRHTRPREQLTEIDEQFWQAAGRRRPVVVERDSAYPAADAEREIVDVALRAPATGDDAVPTALAELAEWAQARPNAYPQMVMALDLWSVAALLHRGDYPDDTAREVGAALVDVDDALTDLRAAADSDNTGDRSPVAQRYADAAERLHAISIRGDAARTQLATGSIEPGWALREFPRWVDAYLDGAPEHHLLVTALQEAARFPSGRFPVSAVSGSDAVQRALRNRDVDRVPVFTAAIPTDVPAAGGTSVTSALSRATVSRWQYAQQVARGTPAGVREAARLLASRPATALVEFAVTKSGVVVFLMTSGADLDAEPLPGAAGWAGPAVFTIPGVTSLDLDDRIYGPSGWMRRYQRRESDELAWQRSTDELLQWLYGELFRPIRRWLAERGVRRLLVVPHRGLHLLPLSAWFTTVRGRRRYVGDAFDVSFAPSLTLLDICRRRIDLDSRTGPRRPFALLDPTSNLPWTRLDALAIVPTPPHGQIITGRDATLRQWADRSLEADPCHYAGHAAYLRADPLASRIELSDGDLTLGAMFDEWLTVAPGAAVVLSGCETALADFQDAADEYLGIAGAFLFAGSATILSTQWAVAEGPAALLIAYYYANLRHADPAAALAAAQRRLRRTARRDLTRLLDRVAELDRIGLLDPTAKGKLLDARHTTRRTRSDFSHPVFWAAYTVTGLHPSAD